MALSAADVSDAFLHYVTQATRTKTERDAMAVLSTWDASPSPLTEPQARALLEVAIRVLETEIARLDEDEQDAPEEESDI